MNLYRKMSSNSQLDVYNGFVSNPSLHFLPNSFVGISKAILPPMGSPLVSVSHFAQWPSIAVVSFFIMTGHCLSNTKIPISLVTFSKDWMIKGRMKGFCRHNENKRGQVKKMGKNEWEWGIIRLSKKAGVDEFVPTD